jgi:hypothetical protein
MAAAVLDASGRYRYALMRGADWGRLCWVMLNPSTADAEVDDATIRRCSGYARAWGYRGYTVVNLFALRATDPRALDVATDPVGPDNDRYLYATAKAAKLVVVAWGQGGERANRDMIVAARLRAMGVKLHCLGTTKSGAPVHPLRQRADLRPIEWPRTEARW